MVSVIIPTYNRAYCIERAITSVLLQSYRNFEIIIVDDASTDNTFFVVDEISSKNPGLIKYHLLKQNVGAANAINVGVDLSCGKYIAFLDSDDTWHPTKLEKQLYQINLNSNAGMITCNALLFNEVKNLSSPWRVNKDKLELKSMLCMNHVLSNSSVLIPTEIIKEIGNRDPSIKIIYDWDYWLSILEAGYVIEIVDEELINYLIHPNNLTFGTGSLLLQDLEMQYIKHRATYNKYKISHHQILILLAKMHFHKGDQKKLVWYYFFKSISVYPFKVSTYRFFVVFLLGKKINYYTNRIISIFFKNDQLWSFD